MTEAVLAIAAVVGAVISVGAGFRLLGRRRRQRGTARIAVASRLREARGVRVRVEVEGSSVFPGMNAARRNVTIGDLALSAERFVLATERGLLLDLTPGTGRPLTGARCTGPGRLLLEGERPRFDGTRGYFRIELAVNDAEDWAARLAPFTSPRPAA